LLAQALHRSVAALRARGRELRPRLDTMAMAGGSTAALDALFLDDEAATATASAPATPAAPPSAFVDGAPAVRSLSERLAEAFRNETPRLLADLADSIAQRDLARAARIAHNIKGSAFYIHSEQLADDAGGLENACDAADDQGVQRHWAALRESIADWMAAH
ncbi:MAG: Hpt domain-containing protein, partial [Vitreoscilla sp.]